ncbi:WD40/YVTN/BNR-like repeat-containing protein [Neptuniibacter sp. QD72_48]|uniref:WD40/YVTN/BNR-like repeat-containing protein n=1 Tax=unclassified Neptuniibacter TaxID=2630693 RepID=UPI0039F5E635
MLKRLPTALLSIALLLNIGLVKADRLQLSALEQGGLDSSLLLDIDVAGQRLVAVGEQGVIIFSDDEGEKWQQAKVPVSTMLTAVNFFNHAAGWAVGHDGVLLSSKDSGAQWQLILNGNQLNQLRVKAIEKSISEISAQEYDPVELENLEYQLDDALFAVDEGASSPLLDIAFIDSQRGFAVGAYGLFIQTEDAGASWHYTGHKLPNPEGLHFNRLFYSKQDELFVLGEAGLLLKSNDKGLSWESLSLPYQGSFFSMVEGDELYLMGLRGNALKRVESGVWEQIELPVKSTINDAVEVDGKLYLVGQGGVLLQKAASGFEAFSKRGLLSYAAVSHLENKLIAVGEAGVTKIALEEGAENE